MATGETGLALVSTLLLVRALAPMRLPLGVHPVAGLAGAVSVAVGLLLPIHPILGVIVATCVYLLVLRLCRRVPPELGELVRGLRDIVLRGR